MVYQRNNGCYMNKRMFTEMSDIDVSKMIKNVKTAALLLMIFIAIFKSIHYLQFGDDCHHIFRHGILDLHAGWHPSSCIANSFDTRKIERCALRHDAVFFFLGDSRLLPLFHEIASSTSEKLIPLHQFRHFHDPNRVLGFSTGKLNMCFLKVLNLNESTLLLLRLWANGETLWNKWPNQYHTDVDACLRRVPSHVVLGLGTEELLLRRNPFTSRLFYKDLFSEFVKTASSIKNTTVFWLTQDPIQVHSLPTKYKDLNNHVINEYNRIAQRAVEDSPNVHLWSVNQLIVKEFAPPKFPNKCIFGKCNSDIPDALRVSAKSLQVNAQLWWIYHCNKFQSQRRPFCCQKHEPITASQYRTFTLIGASIVATLICFLYTQCKMILNRHCEAYNQKPLMRTTSKNDQELLIHSESKVNRVRWYHDILPRFNFSDFYELVYVLSRYGIIMVYFFVCDRTPVFYRQNKIFSWWTHNVSLLSILALGVASIRRTKQTRLNHLDITREWKGWMQLYILMYHYVDGYYIIRCYILARLCVSSYFFLSGFGHLLFFLLQAENRLNTPQSTRTFWEALWFYIQRYLNVMFRMNFLVGSLCFIMNRNYISYYFMALLTSWFCVIFIVMSIVCLTSERMFQSQTVVPNRSRSLHPRVIKHLFIWLYTKKLYWMILTKLVIVLLFIELCHRNLSVFHRIFYTGVVRAIFFGRKFKVAIAGVRNTTCYTRWAMDRYIFLSGMIFGVLLAWSRRLLILNDDTSGNVRLHITNGREDGISLWRDGTPDIDRTIDLESKQSMNATARYETEQSNSLSNVTALRGYLHWSTVLLIVLGMAGIGATVVILFINVERQRVVKYHPYVSWIAIWSFILARNSIGCVRSRYSAFFSWCGDMSLELYVAQYHIWLAADSDHRLILFPEHPVTNITVLTFIFVFVCLEIHELTGRLLPYLIPQTPKSLLFKGPLWVGVVMFLTL